MDRRIRLALSAIAFLVVFNYFYSTIPFTIATIQQFLPKAYTAPDDKPDKIIVDVERAGDFVVYEYWYHWPYDGWEKKDDWEPIFVYVKGNDVYAIAFRVHYNWRVNFDPPMEDGRVRITFLYRWHTPLLTPPPSDFVAINITPIVGNPPENLDPSEIIGIPNPMNNAFVSAVLYGFVVAGVVYVVTGWRWFGGRTRQIRL